MTHIKEEEAMKKGGRIKNVKKTLKLNFIQDKKDLMNI